MDAIKAPFYALLQLIDNGKFFKKPSQWLYVLNGIIAIIAPFFWAYVFYDNVGAQLMRYAEGWDKIVLILTMLFVFAIAVLLGYLGFLFWIHRSKRLGMSTKRGDENVALPVWAHLVQTTVEYLGLFFGLGSSISLVSMFFYSFFSFKTEIFQGLGYSIVESDASFINYIVGVLAAIAGLILIIIVIWIIAYVVILCAHVMGESIRIKASIANDTRDMGDILRATTIIENDAQETPAVEEEKEEENA